MHLRKVAFATLASFFSLGVFASTISTNTKPVMVYYLPWYSAKPFSSEWGWHWTMNHFQPDKPTAVGDKEIASWYYPLIGPYDSADPAVLEYHVLLMKLAGIDGVIVDWFGSADYFDYATINRNINRLFEYTRKAGLKFAICYEDQTIQRFISGGRLNPGDAIRHAQDEMLYLQSNFFREPSYLRINGQPLLETFGPQYFLDGTNWDQIFSVLQPSNRPAFFSEDNKLGPASGAFDWPPMWLSQRPGTGGVLSEASLRNYLNDFEMKGAAWPEFISSAFPRFHDIYEKASVRNYWGYLGDRDGQTLRETLSRALTNSSVLVQVVTWNDFGEGTMIEPTAEYGFRDLSLIQDFCRQNSAKQNTLPTNTLPSVLEYYRLRCRSGTNAALAQALDQIFTNLVSDRQKNPGDLLRQVETEFSPHQHL
jgi:hypothetical protein